jgi:hypothetical protein
MGTISKLSRRLLDPIMRKKPSLQPYLRSSTNLGLMKIMSIFQDRLLVALKKQPSKDDLIYSLGSATILTFRRSRRVKMRWIIKRGKTLRKQPRQLRRCIPKN